MIVSVLFIIFVGLGGGITVGAGFVAFLTVMGIIPRLMQLTKTMRFVQAYEAAVILGAVCGGWETLHMNHLFLTKWIAVPVGLLAGVFVGMLAAALTEVLNVLPILAKRIGLRSKIIILLMAIVIGKIVGSLFHWLYFIDHS
ncbi:MULTISPECIES: stage V sporulation protein SpoVAB [Bacillus]|uniref:Stage V sporulation protein SpoVAB n=1 Tax=Bacillus cabrialesii subsp. tritici TaxID=2944916 RepID=A0ABT9DLM1_9BACI|nr:MULTISPECIES: stage V sporulation protein SpoVAB [Bacillus]AUZ26947.1 stage V sporulation protein AB [Bacillus cereus]KJJ40460.1 stage V sporulation protein AB [Bacillus subtilis]OLQ56340.1 stage V sporulation protein AB [Bacillus licheniformis]MBU2658027.1 stage V sporulation protein SpoVAB [Bacillus cabrialesii]MDO8225568.1 stage V sporulation protein SpoVAB [Bacillus cabrialesii subsp. tritici]